MRFTLEVAQDAITILLFIGVLTRVDILCAIAQEAVNQPGELVSRGRDRLGAALLVSPERDPQLAQDLAEMRELIGYDEETEGVCAELDEA
jgi:hypothetical protein